MNQLRERYAMYRRYHGRFVAGTLAVPPEWIATAAAIVAGLYIGALFYDA